MAINQSTYSVDEGYVPEYHTGRRYSQQDQVYYNRSKSNLGDI